MDAPTRPEDADADIVLVAGSVEGGSPARAPAKIKATVDRRYASRLPEFEKVLGRVASRL